MNFVFTVQVLQTEEEFAAHDGDVSFRPRPGLELCGSRAYVCELRVKLSGPASARVAHQIETGTAG